MPMISKPARHSQPKQVPSPYPGNSGLTRWEVVTMRNKTNPYQPILILLLLLFYASFLSVGSTAAATVQSGTTRPEKSNLTIGLPALSVSFLPVWVADQNGLLRGEGMTDVKVLVFQGGAPMVQALASGTIDLCLTSLSEVVNTLSSGQKFKAVWAGYNMPYFDWYAQPKFKKIADTKGGKYGVSKYGTLTDSLTRYALRSSGLDPDKDVRILQLGGSPQAFAAMEAGQIDAAILPSPLSYMAAEKGYVKLMSQKEQIAPDWPTHVVYTKEEFIPKNPGTLKAFLRATGKAIDWIKTNPDEAAQFGSKQLKFKLEHSRMAINDIQDEWHPDGRLPGKGSKVFWEITLQAGEVKEPWPNDRWLDETFLKTQSEWRR